MADNRFIGGNQLGLLDNSYGAPTSIIRVTTVSGTTAYTAASGLTRPVRVVAVYGVMTAAGGAGMTLVVNNGSTAITETLDLSAAGDKEVFSAATIDDAQYLVAKNGSINVTTAGNLASELYIEVVNT